MKFQNHMHAVEYYGRPEVKRQSKRRQMVLAMLFFAPFLLGGFGAIAGIVSEGVPFFANLKAYGSAFGMGMFGLVGVWYCMRVINRTTKEDREAFGN